MEKDPICDETHEETPSGFIVQSKGSSESKEKESTKKDHLASKEVQELNEWVWRSLPLKNESRMRLIQEWFDNGSRWSKESKQDVIDWEKQAEINCKKEQIKVKEHKKLLESIDAKDTKAGFHMMDGQWYPAHCSTGKTKKKAARRTKRMKKKD